MHLYGEVGISRNWDIIIKGHLPQYLNIFNQLYKNLYFRHTMHPFKFGYVRISSYLDMTMKRHLLQTFNLLQKPHHPSAY